MFLRAVDGELAGQGEGVHGGADGLSCADIGGGYGQFSKVGGKVSCGWLQLGKGYNGVTAGQESV